MSNGKKSLFNKWCWENWTATCRIMKWDHHKNRLKMDERPQCEMESTKILEDNTSIDHRCSNFFLDTTPKARETKVKMNYWDFIKIRSFCTAKEITKKTERSCSWLSKIQVKVGLELKTLRRRPEPRSRVTLSTLSHPGTPLFHETFGSVCVRVCVCVYVCVGAYHIIM
uniref:Uncharacterized protein n=1 Tax=Mustela putorius furo TaxID=9669 RepID=M3YW27_MUSPF